MTRMKTKNKNAYLLGMRFCYYMEVFPKIKEMGCCPIDFGNYSIYCFYERNIVKM